MAKHQRDDVTTDPRLDDGREVDWASEGGALPEGPATDPDEDDAPAGPTLAEDDVPEDR
jgi:hypothetical protein